MTSLTNRSEPKGCTLGDLLAMVLGTAVALSLYWYSDKIGATMPKGAPAPRGLLWWNRSLELTLKAATALVFVILARRWRYGGPLQAVDYLPILTAFSQVSLTVWQWPKLGILTGSVGSPGLVLVNPDAFWFWRIGNLFVGLGAVLLVLILRRRGPPGWFAGLWLALAWQMITYFVCMGFQKWANDRLSVTDWSTSMIVVVSTTLVQGPLGVVAYMPLAIAVVDFLRDPWARRTWVQATTFGVYLILPIAYQGRDLARKILAAEPLGFFYAMNLGGWFASIGVAYLLARRFEWVWRRALEGHASANEMSLDEC